MELQAVCMEARAAGGYAMIDDSAERLRVDRLSQAMEMVAAAPRGERGAAFEQAALVARGSAKRLPNHYTAWKRAKTDAERAEAFWKLNAAELASPWALKSIPLVEWRVANFALATLQPLVTALKRRVAEGE